ncbi:MAG TPA: hypothetical protein VGL56_01455 [Fimbriimonadaceae bacterium]|jgi:hypothetical protein
MELAKKLLGLGEIKVLDLSQAAIARAIHQPWMHDGFYYLLPPEGYTGQDIQKLFDEGRDAGEVNYTYNAQSSMDMNHKPILPLDPYANKYFSNPPHGFLKILAVARSKVEKLSALLDELKRPFDPESFPHLKELVLSNFKEPSAGHQTSVALRLIHEDWKHLSALESDLKDHIAEQNLVREIFVTRHSVKGLPPEVTLNSTEATTEKGTQFLLDLAAYVKEHQPKLEEIKIPVGAAIAAEPVPELNFSVPAFGGPRPQAVAVVEDPSTNYKHALEHLVTSLKLMEDFAGITVTVAGLMALIEMPKKGFMGLAGHFDKSQEGTLYQVCQSVKIMPGLHGGWAVFYHYDKTTRVLSIKVGPEDMSAPPGWQNLTQSFV